MKRSYQTKRYIQGPFRLLYIKHRNMTQIIFNSVLLLRLKRWCSLLWDIIVWHCCYCYTNDAKVCTLYILCLFGFIQINRHIEIQPKIVNYCMFQFSNHVLTCTHAQYSLGIVIFVLVLLTETEENIQNVIHVCPQRLSCYDNALMSLVSIFNAVL